MCRISDYQLIDKIGGGAVGSVWKGTHLSSTGERERVALKIQDLGSPTSMDRQFYKDVVFPDLHQPNIMSLLAVRFGTSEHDAPCPQLGNVNPSRLGLMVSPLLAGDLFSFLSKLSLQQKIDVFSDVLCGLVNLHENKIVYGDLKPENVLLQLGAGQIAAKLSDFGLFWPQGAKMTKCLQGSIPYMAPEQAISNLRCNAAMDLWSAGVTGLLLFFGVTLIREDHYLPSPKFRQDIIHLYQSWEQQLGIREEQDKTPPQLILYLYNLFMTWGFPNPAWIQHLTDPKRARLLTHLIHQMETAPQVLAVQQSVRKQLEDTAAQTPPLKEVILPLLRSLLAFDPSQRPSATTALAQLQKLTSHRCTLARLPLQNSEAKKIQLFHVHKGPSEQEHKWIQQTLANVQPSLRGLHISSVELQSLADRALLLMAEYRASSTRLQSSLSNFFPLVFACALWMIIQLNVNTRSSALERYFALPLHLVPGLELSACVNVLKDMILQLRQRVYLLGGVF